MEEGERFLLPDLIIKLEIEPVIIWNVWRHEEYKKKTKLRNPKEEYPQISYWKR